MHRSAKTVMSAERVAEKRTNEYLPRTARNTEWLLFTKYSTMKGNSPPD